MIKFCFPCRSYPHRFLLSTSLNLPTVVTIHFVTLPGWPAVTSPSSSAPLPEVHPWFCDIRNLPSSAAHLPQQPSVTTTHPPSVTLSVSPSRPRLSRTTGAHVAGCLWEVLGSPPPSFLSRCLLVPSSSLPPSSPLNLYEYYLRVVPLWTKKPSRVTGKKDASSGSERSRGLGGVRNECVPSSGELRRSVISRTRQHPPVACSRTLDGLLSLPSSCPSSLSVSPSFI